MAVVIDQQVRPAGTLTSSAAPTARFDGRELTAAVLLDPSVLTDPTAIVTMAVEGNDQTSGNVGGWYTVTAADWHGGSVDRQGNPIPPVLVFRSDDIAARRLRGRLTWNQTLNIGLDVTVA